MSDLTDLDRAILDLAGKHWRYPGSFDEAKRELTGTAIRFDQRLNELLDEPAALAYAPLTVNRLKRIRAHRHRRSTTTR